MDQCLSTFGVGKWSESIVTFCQTSEFHNRLEPWNEIELAYIASIRPDLF